MEKQATQPQSPLFEKLRELKLMEDTIAKKISPTLLDYTFIFAPDLKYDIKVSNLSAEGLSLINNYVKKADDFAKGYKIPTQQVTGNPIINFVSRIRDMYMLRFVEARALYGEYELYRIPTLFENKIHDISPITYTPPQDTMSFILPDIFVTDESGAIDWKKTMKQEALENRISRYVTAYKNAMRLENQMFIDLEIITTRGFAFIILEKEMRSIINQVLVKIFYFFSGEVFKYINRNYSLDECVNNVFEYYLPFALKGNDVFMRELKPLFDDIKNIIFTSLDGIKEIDKPTKEMLLDDFFELTIAYFRTKMAFAKDYYKTVPRDFNEFYEYERGNNYQKILDLYMYIPEGGITEMALESFFIDFSYESKFLIFKAVVGEVENPLFTLKNYLREK